MLVTVAMTAVNRGLVLRMLGKREKGIAAHDDVLSRYGQAAEPGTLPRSSTTAVELPDLVRLQGTPQDLIMILPPWARRSPEVAHRIVAPSRLILLGCQRSNVAVLAIDTAHCVERWARRAPDAGSRSLLDRLEPPSGVEDRLPLLVYEATRQELFARNIHSKTVPTMLPG